jgi:hypothetical protein
MGYINHFRCNGIIVARDEKGAQTLVLKVKRFEREV